MIRIDIPRNLQHLTFSGNITRLQFNVYEKSFIEQNQYASMPSLELYDWLIENVGYELETFRELDRPYYDTCKVPKGIESIGSHDEWEAKNPPVVGARTWKMGARGEAIYFTSLELATLFKLRWF